MTLEAQEGRWEPEAGLETPFAEAFAPRIGVSDAVGFTPWRENNAPFSPPAGAQKSPSDRERLFGEALGELRDEGFDEALAFLAEETEQAVGDRFSGETAGNAGERERFAETQLSPLRFEAHQYLDRLAAELEGKDLESLGPEQLDEVLQRVEPTTGELTPAGEEFLGSLVRKAKGAVKFVAKAAKGVGKIAGALVGPVLSKLKALINPLLRRVLAMAIGRLPAPLQPAARALAARLTQEAEAEAEEEMSPTNLTDVGVVSESFDAALAEAMVGQADGGEAPEGEAFGPSDEAPDSRQLEVLAEARGILLDRLGTAADEEDLAPAIEQFAPAIIGALKLGLRLIGRPKVVSFLAGYLGPLIRRWVGPNLSRPLSNAIVDTGLRLVSLEAPGEALGELGEGGAGPVALASVVEDTIRRLAENEDYVFEDEGLMQMAASEAFSQAVATHFPGRLVRHDLQPAPSLGGAFVTRRPRSLRPFSKYSRLPEVEITEQIADALPAFGGSTLGAVLRAAGARFPLRARLHIYQAAVGSTVARMLQGEQAGARSLAATALVQPLTRSAAGLLLREPALGVDPPPAFLRSRHRIGAGQRLYRIEPMGAEGAALQTTPGATRAQTARVAASRLWVRPASAPGQVLVGFHLSEADAQKVAEALRLGRGPGALLQAVASLMGATRLGPRRNLSRLRGEDEAQEMEELVAAPGKALRPGRRLLARLRRWVLPAISAWVRQNAEAFLRAAAHPDAGVTITAHLAGLRSAKDASGGRGAPPTVAIAVVAGHRRT